MRRVVSVVVLISCALAAVGAAQSVFATYEQLTAGVNAPAKSLTETTTDIPGRGQVLACDVQVESGSVRYRVDGPAPTATVGMPLPPGVDLRLSLLQAQRFQVIQHVSASTTALVNVSCWR